MKEPNYWDWCSCKDLGVQCGTFISGSKAARQLSEKFRQGARKTLSPCCRQRSKPSKDFAGHTGRDPVPTQFP